VKPTWPYDPSVLQTIYKGPKGSGILGLPVYIEDPENHIITSYWMPENEGELAVAQSGPFYIALSIHGKLVPPVSLEIRRDNRR
jgi:hypothetical protein